MLQSKVEVGQGKPAEWKRTDRTVYNAPVPQSGSAAEHIIGIQSSPSPSSSSTLPHAHLTPSQRCSVGDGGSGKPKVLQSQGGVMGVGGGAVPSKSP